MEAIFKRRSVRKFTPDPVDDGDVTRLLRAAMRAPSAGNQQPWEFVVLKNRENMQGIKDFHPYARMLDQAPLTVVVCGNTERQKFDYDYWVQDCSAAIQNLLLEAVHLNLGAVWLGLYPIPERVEGMQTLLGLPAHVIPLGAVAVGHPAETPEPLDTYLPERVHRERWGE